MSHRAIANCQLRHRFIRIIRVPRNVERSLLYITPTDPRWRRLIARHVIKSGLTRAAMEGSGEKDGDDCLCAGVSGCVTGIECLDRHNARRIKRRQTREVNNDTYCWGK